MRAAALALAALVALGACAIPFEDPRFQQRQDALVGTALMQPAAPVDRPHLWYIGLGMQGETWSENDVAETAARVARVATGYDVTPIIFSNRFAAMPERYPAVDGRSVEQATTAISQRAKPGDVVLIYVSTHGAPGFLGRSAGGRELPPVGAEQLQRWLAPLEGSDTVLILSACFAGSLIPSLMEDHRIIFTAARADRTSFGCRAGAEHTVFGEALLSALTPDASLHAIVDHTRAAVTEREHEIGVKSPSFPQISVGPAVARLYNAPIF